MVSIPDWSKLAHFRDAQRDNSDGGLSKYYKQREHEAIRLAEEHGYFLTATENYLLDKCGRYNGQNVRSVNKLKLVKLVGVHLRRVGDINYCINLTICDLSKNFLTKIEGLAACRSLIKLDLHSNQLSTLPGMSFWSNLHKLKFLLLNDNPLGMFEDITSLSPCSRLVALTLYDTPISLKKNYRHHVVNSVFSLKALDHHIIADEEIIEDAVMAGKFGAIDNAFKIDLCTHSPEDATFADELRLMHRIERRINRVISHHSPVLIVQRYVRGYLCRKEMSNSLRWTTDWKPKTIPIVKSFAVPPPPTSPVGGNGSARGVSDSGMDYDTYIQNRRPGSILDDGPYRPPNPESQLEPFPTPVSQISSHKSKHNIMINLSKLDSSTMQYLNDEAEAIESVLPSHSQDHGIHLALTENQKKTPRKKKEEPEKTTKMKSVKQFFGPVVSASTSEDDFFVDSSDFNDEVPLTAYRLRGHHQKMFFMNPVKDMILTRRDAGNDIRAAEAEYHRKNFQTTKKKTPFQRQMTLDQRVFNKNHGAMGLSCLYAVHKAYRDRERAEKTAAKMEHILNLKEERERARERIRLYQDEKRNLMIQQKEVQQNKIVDNLEKLEHHRLNYLGRKYDNHARFSDLFQLHKMDHTFVSQFSNQHTSVSKALMHHDRQVKSEDESNIRADRVQSSKAGESEKQNVVSKYLEHRQLMRQTESAMARTALDTRMLQEANERIMKARARVSQLKTRRNTVQDFYPLPQSKSSIPAPQSAPQGAGWQTDMFLQPSTGPISRQTTLISH